MGRKEETPTVDHQCTAWVNYPSGGYFMRVVDTFAQMTAPTPMLGSKLYHLRRNKDFSQEYMAEKLGVTQSTYSRWEAGEVLPKLDVLKRMAEVLEIFRTTAALSRGLLPDPAQQHRIRIHRQQSCAWRGGPKVHGPNGGAL